ncbi:hypothetical protein [Trinickia sp. EG282A]|uniref:hypothetical protein n=1 Tax=Trinickia sp. EG282A TaxID=3237013 RepID=UPI0034D350FD
MPSINITVDGKEPLPDERRPFFTGKIVTVVAYVRIDNGSIGDSDTVGFQPFGTGASMLPYDGFKKIDKGLVIVGLTRDSVDSKAGTATFRALVWTTNPDEFYATYDKIPTLTSDPYRYKVIEPSATSLVPQATMLSIPPAGDVATPASGNHAHYRFFVWDPDQNNNYAPLRDMCIRLICQAEPPNINRYAFYREMTDGPNQQLEVDSNNFVELVTDASGAAEVFVCGKFNASAVPDVPIATADKLFWQLGVASDSGYAFDWLIMLDLSKKANIAPPEVPQQLNLTSNPRVTIGIPFYQGATPSDIAFLFCNGEFQGASPVVPKGEANDVATFNISTSSLRSKDYNDRSNNSLQYAIKLRAGDVIVSFAASVSADGIPPAIHPPAVEGETPAPPPLPVGGSGFVAGWPINGRGGMLQLRVPLEDPALDSVKVKDIVEMYVYLNGYRPWADGLDEPRGKVLQGVYYFTVTPMIKNGQPMIFDFQAADLTGFGNKFTTGEMGTLEAQYTIFSSDAKDKQTRAALYRSLPLTLGLDTVPPAGAGVRDGDAMADPLFEAGHGARGSAT